MSISELKTSTEATPSPVSVDSPQRPRQFDSSRLSAASQAAIVVQAAAAPDSTKKAGEPELNRETIRRFGVFGTSLILHLLFLLILACIVLPHGKVSEILSIFAAPEKEQPLHEGKGDDPVEGFENGIPDLEEMNAPLGDIHGPELIDTGPPLKLDFNDGPATIPLSAVSATGVPVAINIGSDFGGRSLGARGALVRAGGGSPESEAAVELGLEWLANHQSSDGSWSFDHRMNAKCAEDCTEEGRISDCRTGATAMALLAFLGAGHTPRLGKYSMEVRKGLDYLVMTMDVNELGGDVSGESNYRSMYVQGLATIALCEAYAMTIPHGTGPADDSDLKDDVKAKANEAKAKAKVAKAKSKAKAQNANNPKRSRRNTARRANGKKSLPLDEAAQLAIDYIMAAQDEEGGGWRYMPKMRGDTSVVGWQVMALQSARAGSLATRPEVFKRVGYFLDNVAAEDGSQYGYMSPEIGRHSTTAVALLCRMYMGWNRDNPGLRRGIEILSESGPDFGDMYYNYYATQVMHHWGGEAWNKWNRVMRDHLVQTQIKEGHAAGSWDVADAHGGSGGRLYMTALCIMTLEVYYRHLPLYQRETLEQVLMGKKAAK